MITWTPENDAILKELWPTHTGQQIGKILGCSKSAIHMRVHHLGIRRSVVYNDAIAVQFRVPCDLIAALRADAKATGRSATGIIAMMLYERYGIEKPTGFNPCARNGGPRPNSGRKRKANPATYSKPSMPFVNIGRD